MVLREPEKGESFNESLRVKLDAVTTEGFYHLLCHPLISDLWLLFGQVFHLFNAS